MADDGYENTTAIEWPHPATIDGAQFIVTHPDEFSEFEVDWAQRTIDNKRSYGRDR